MSTGQQVPGDVDIEVENVGGIESTQVSFSPGVTLLVGRNATNRTSFLRAIQAVCGSHDVSVKGDADTGRISLEMNGETVSLELSRTNGAVHIAGDPLVDDPSAAELFAFLLGSNDARQAVGGTENLRELVMRPIDVDEIEAAIDRLIADREDIDRQLEGLEDRKAELPDLEERRTQIEKEIEATREELATVETALAAEEADLEESRAEQAELDDRLEELSETRSTLEDVRYQLETEQESLAALKTELEELSTEREELPATPAGEIEEIEATLSRLRDRKQQLETEVSDIQRLVQFNREMLEEGLPPVGDKSVGGPVTDELVDGDTRRCWTCGSEVEVDQIEATVEHLRETRQATAEDLSTVEADIQSARDDLTDLKRIQRRSNEIDRRLSDLESEIDDTTDQIETLTERRESLTDEVTDLEAAVDALDEDSYGDVIETHKEANQLEYELGRLESDRERVADEIAEIESEIGREDQLADRRSEIQAEIEDLRTRIERIEADMIDAFNDHMDTILDRLAYENIERIWLDRLGTDTATRSVGESDFELHVVRTTDAGVSYEDTVDHLSESERELTGLVFAFAGYLAHEVYETVPFMLVDSVEAIDAERIDTIIDYLREYPEYLVVALLPEDAAAVDDAYQRVTQI